MKVCLVCDNYPPARTVGGIEYFTETLAQGLVARGHAVSVVGSCADIERLLEENRDGVRVLRLPRRGKGLVPRALADRWLLEATIRREIRDHGIDIVEAPDVRGSLLLGHFGTPLVVRMHGAHFVHFRATGRPTSASTEFFERHTLGLATHLVAVSQYIRDATLSGLGAKNRKCPVIYNGVDTDVFRRKSAVRRVPGRIVFVGRLSETKGAPNLFRALPLVFEKYPRASFRFVGLDPIVAGGKRASKSLLGSLPARYRGRVHLKGEVRHQRMPEEYLRASVAVFPSRVEAHPIAVLEAMACGTPVVFMKSGPGPEMIEHGRDGILCDTTSPSEIAEALSFLLDRPGAATRMGRQAARKVRGFHSVPHFIESNEAFYAACLSA